MNSHRRQQRQRQRQQQLRQRQQQPQQPPPQQQQQQHNEHEQKVHLSSDAVSIMFRGDESVDFPNSPLVVRLVAVDTAVTNDDAGAGTAVGTAAGTAAVTNGEENDDGSSSADDDELCLTTAVPVWVVDATCRGRAYLIGPALEEVFPSRLPCVALIRGYVTSKVNPGNPHPLLFLCTVDVLPFASVVDSSSPSAWNMNSDMINSIPKVSIPPVRTPGGRVFEFLTGMAHFLSNQDFAAFHLRSSAQRTQLLQQQQNTNSSSNNNNNNSSTILLDCCAVVSQFIEHAKAVQTLESSSFEAASVSATATASMDEDITVNDTSNDNNNTTSSSTATAAANASGNDSSANSQPRPTMVALFRLALDDFIQSQVERQSTTLASHLGPTNSSNNNTHHQNGNNNNQNSSSSNNNNNQNDSSSSNNNNSNRASGVTTRQQANHHPKRAELVVNQHKQALLTALEHATTTSTTTVAAAATMMTSTTTSSSSTSTCLFTVPLLKEWHRILSQDLHPGAGHIRTTAVRVGHTCFRPTRLVEKDLQQVCTALNQLYGRLRWSSSNHDLDNQNNNMMDENMDSKPSPTSATTTATLSSASPATTTTAQYLQFFSSIGYKAAVYAAMVFFAIVDTHAFSDGNGRLARIASNFALAKFGFTIPICLFATPAQRKEYTHATVMTRRNLYLLERGAVPQETLVQVYQQVGVVTPLVKIFLQRMKTAVLELTKVVQDKQRAQMEHDQVLAARTFRERAAEGNCLICFDENPNICTLCCGKAAHLNCLAEWLITKDSCPNCRGQLPALSNRILQGGRRRRQDDDNEDDDDDDDDDGSTTDMTTIFSDSSRSSTTVDDSSNSSTGSTTTTIFSVSDDAPQRHPSNDMDDTVRIAVAAAMAAVTAANNNNNADDTTTMSVENEDTTTASMDDDDSNNNMAAVNHDNNDTTIDADSTNSTTEDDDDDEKCRNCNNKAARNCENNLCGRCCQNVGQFQCARHGNLG